MATINGSSEEDALGGTGGDDLIRAFGGDDYAEGVGGSDSINGGSGNDFLFSEALFLDRPPPGGNDTLNGGSENDTLAASFSSDNVTMIGGTGTDTIQIGLQNGNFSLGGTVSLARIDLGAGRGTYRISNVDDEHLDSISIDLFIEEVENVNGMAYGETISGSAEANVLNGQGGNDALQGRGGADTLNGGTGFDRAFYDESKAVNIDLNRSVQVGGDAEGDVLTSIEGVDGSRLGDTIRGSSGNNDLFGNLGDDLLEGRGGADTIDGGGGIDTASYTSSAGAVSIRVVNTSSGQVITGLNSDAAGDRLTSIEIVLGSNFNDQFVGSFGNDHFRGAGGNDRLTGGDGADTLEGGSGNDTLIGGEGIDTAIYSSSVSPVIISLADGSVRESGFTDSLSGIENVVGSLFFGTTFGGNDANNVFTGGGGSDSFRSSLGNDRYVGAGGTDTVDLSSETAGATVNFGPATITFAGRPGEQDTFSSIERVIGTGFSDTFTSSVSGSEIMVGGRGDDTFNVNDAADLVQEGSGEGNDTVLAAVSYALALGQEIETLALASPSSTIARDLTGNEFAQMLRGNAGRNVLSGLAGDDTLEGGAGDDTLAGGEGDDVLVGSASGGTDRDTADYSSSTVQVRVNLQQERAQDTGQGLDTLSGIENVTGGAFNDVFQGSASDNIFRGGGGTDRVLYTGAASGVLASLETGQASGSATGFDTLLEIEELHGSRFADLLAGDVRANRLDGLEGADTLQGGGGADTLFGRQGDDAFRYRTALEGGDLVGDFSNLSGNDDRFEIEVAGFGGGLVAGGTLAASQFQSRADNLAQDADDRFIFRTTDRTLWFDVDGTGATAATMIADLQNGAVVTNQDIQLV